MITIRCTGLFRSETGQTYVTFDSGAQREFNSDQEVIDFGIGIDAPASDDWAQKALVRWWRQRDPNGSNLDLIVGREITVDFSAAEPVKVI